MKMAQLLISLPPGTKFDEFEAFQMTHPKGQEVTFLKRQNRLYELNHRKVETNMCFVTSKTTTSKFRAKSSPFLNFCTSVEQPEIIQATPFDVMFLLIPELVKLQEKGKVSLGDLELNKNLRSIVDALKIDDVDKYCETSELNSQIYVKLSTEKLYEELAKRHARLFEIMNSQSIMQEYSAGK